jgi:hypothetical protein
MGCAAQSTISPGALQILDSVACAIVEEPARNDPPPAPSEGASYIVGSAPTSTWMGKTAHIATMSASGWRYIAPFDGLHVLVRSTMLRAEYVGGAWQSGPVRASSIEIGGEKVVSTRAASVSGPAGGVTVDVEARASIEAILAALRHHGLIAT